ncbi:MAG: glycerophosphodiester phosphodiesterase [Fusicatenibacter sp.]|nr:glycerophosphodiester phosphodiesterase [Lachnospiraceae bacterium]MDY2938402.1 glycerophosphodiester phosphodiesterase [Fusicatenibacter sp.]
MIKTYLKTAWKLLYKNIWSLILFEAVYRVFSNFLIVKLSGRAIQFALKQCGYSYMTSENYNDVMLHPLTILIIVGLLMMVLFFMMFEVFAVLGYLEASWRREKIRIPEMFGAGAVGTVRFIRRYPFAWFLYIAASFPYLWIHSSYSAINSMRLLKVTATKIIEAFPAVWMPVLLLVLVVIFSFLFSYSLPFRFLMEEKEERIRRRVKNVMRGKALREFGINLLLHLTIAVVSLILFFTAGAAVVLYARYVKTPSTVVSAVIVYGDWLKTVMGVVTGAIGIVGSVTYLYLIFTLSDRRDYQRSRTFPKNSRLIRIIRGPAAAAVLSVAIIAGESVYIIRSMQQDLPSATASSGYISVSAHRGGARKAPENTMSAVKYAVESMADYAEIDVQETSDGEIVLLHDSNLKRTTGLNANIWTLTYDEVSQLDAGARFNKAFRGEPVPKLEDIIQYAKGKINLNIEVKYNGHNLNIVKKVIKIIEENDFVENCVLTSMNYNYLKQAKKLNPDIKTGYTMKMTYGDLEDLDAADFFSVKYSYITEQFVENAHSIGKEVCAWTLNYQGDIQRMVNCGVDNIITDDPELVRKVILGEIERSPDFLDLLMYLVN